MAQKFVLVAVVAILIALEQGLAIEDHSDEKLTGEISHLIHRLEVEVNKILDKANKSLSNAEVKLNATACAVQGKALDLLKKSEKQLENGLDNLKKKASAAGVNIDDCLDGNEQKLLNLPNVFTDHVIHCFSDNVIQGIKDLQDVLNKVQKLASDLTTIQQNFEKCKKEHNINRCMLQIALRVREEKKLLTKIGKDAILAELYIVKLPEKIEACGITTLAETEIQLKKLVDTMSTCIIKKLHH